jgi:organic hydroperoxide reductase OsmC/OhrA
MSKHHQYKLTIKWTGNKGSGTSDYKAYDRSHEISIKGKKKLMCSSDSPFRGDEKKYNPEDMLLASLSSCHMLWYLHLCADEGIIVLEYSDNAEGKMIQTSNGSGYFTEVILNPKVIVAESNMLKKAIDLHKKANSYCFIANSVKFEVYHKPQITVADK